MALTRSSFIPLGIVTRGLGATDPIGGASRALRGLIGEYEGGVEPVEEDLGALLSPESVDSLGTPRILNKIVVALNYAEVSASTFANPDSEYTGYAADGYWYTNGVRDATHVPYRATWATEGESASEDRGNLDRFPSRLLVLGTRAEVVLLHADTLDVWMRFRVGVTAPPARGGFLGGPTTQIRKVRLVNGLLFVATNTGLRIADFRNDLGYHYTSTDYALSRTTPTTLDGGLVNRNDDTYMDGYSEATSPLISDDCLCVDARVVSGGKELLGSVDEIPYRRIITVAAVGHAGGITALSFGYDPSSATAVGFVKHECSLSVGTDWEALDDDDDDVTTPFFVDHLYGATNWSGEKVRPGDRLVAGGTNYTIQSVDQTTPGYKLSLLPELSYTATGSGYTITRDITAIFIAPNLDLYMAASSGVEVNRSRDWFAVSPIVPGTALYTELEFRGNTSRMTFPATITSLAWNGSTMFVGSSEGVFSVTESDIDRNVSAGLTYATPAQSELTARYPILGGSDKEVVDVVIDPETGHLLVAATGFSSTVTEIDLSIQQAFRYTSGIGLVFALVSYRNPSGPPTQAVD